MREFKPNFGARVLIKAREWQVSLRIEQHSPLVLAFLLGAFVSIRCSFSESQTRSIITEVLPVAITSLAIYAGFHAVAHAMFLRLHWSYVVKILEQAGARRRVSSYFWRAMVGCMAFVAFGILLCLLCAVDAGVSSRGDLFIPVLVFTGAWAALLSLRISYLMNGVIAAARPGEI